MRKLRVPGATLRRLIAVGRPCAERIHTIRRLSNALVNCCGSWVGPTRLVSTYLTIVAMAALGLSADVRMVAKAGSRVVAAVSLSLLVLIALGIAIIHLLRIR